MSRIAEQINNESSYRESTNLEPKCAQKSIKSEVPPRPKT